MTNPGNIVRIRSRNGGRASVYEANMWAQAYSTGLLDGQGVKQNTPSADMHVLVGGSSTNPDVILASNPAGYNIALDLVGQQSITLTAPASNSRISSIVAYTDDLSVSSADTTNTGTPGSCGLIVVNGATAASPTAPNDATIRSAITSDGATGSQAAYCVLAEITIASATTTITDTMIAAGAKLAQMSANKINIPTLTVKVATSENTTSGSFANLATVGPQLAVDVPSNGKLTVTFSASINSSSVDQAARAAFTLSGANTRAAQDDEAIETQTIFSTCTRTISLTGLTPGSTTVTMVYMRTGGTGTFRRRSMTVAPGI